MEFRAFIQSNLNVPISCSSYKDQYGSYRIFLHLLHLHFCVGSQHKVIKHFLWLPSQAIEVDDTLSFCSFRLLVYIVYHTYTGSQIQNLAHVLCQWYIYYTQQKKFLDTSNSPIFPEMFHIRPIKTSQEAGGCLLYVNTKFVRFGW